MARTARKVARTSLPTSPTTGSRRRRSKGARMRNLRTRVDAGFTLVEVLVVLAIVSVLLAVTSPSLRSFTEGRKLVSGGDALKGTCAFARDTATTEGVGYAVVLDLENARYWVAAEAALETFDLSETLGENAYGAEQEATTEETAAPTA
ncbi:prepilin-type N-terminal cleavage/methylation domain-containing protein, partial [Candidatus Poribacteria bacterium]|nr:prepilin-type N-terminal cleavage/methylation domain-containing protein [Candidatus Poribacteria bacterium]